MTERRVSGSDDFDVVSELMQGMSAWRTNDGKCTAAQRAFSMLLCARVFVLKQFMRYIPKDTDPAVARRRWVFAQVMPPRLPSGDMFVNVLQSVRAGRKDIMLSIVHATLNAIIIERGDLFPVRTARPLFVVIDEAQVAADHLKDVPSATGTDLRPVLRELYSFCLKSHLFTGIILAGTGLLMNMVKKAVGSVSAKKTGKRQPLLFTNVGRFRTDNSSQVDYICRYLTLSENDESDRRLLERMVYWFSGRYVCRVMLQDVLIFRLIFNIVATA